MLIRAKYESIPENLEMEEILVISHQELQRFDEQNDEKTKGGICERQ